jgi:hypothetical protein
MLASILGFYFGDITHVFTPGEVTRITDALKCGSIPLFAVCFSDKISDCCKDNHGNQYITPGKNIGLVPLEYTRDGSEYSKGVVVQSKSVALFTADDNEIRFELKPDDYYTIVLN